MFLNLNASSAVSYFCYNFRAKCIARQCHRLNSKYKTSCMVHTSADTVNIVTEEQASDVEFANPYQVERSVNNIEIIDSLIDDIVSHVVSLKGNTADLNSSNQNVGRLKSKARIFPCPICKQMFAQYVSSAKHCKILKAKTIKCSVCDKDVDRRNFERHTKTHDENKTHKSKICTICQVTFASNQKLEYHMFIKHNGRKPTAQDISTSSGPKFKCSLCEFKHHMESKVKRHITMTHSLAEKLTCSECDYKCHSKSGMYFHKAQVHNNDKNSVSSTISHNNMATGSSHVLSNSAMPSVSSEPTEVTSQRPCVSANPSNCPVVSEPSIQIQYSNPVPTSNHLAITKEAQLPVPQFRGIAGSQVRLNNNLNNYLTSFPNVSTGTNLCQPLNVGNFENGSNMYSVCTSVRSLSDSNVYIGNIDHVMMKL